MCLCVYVCVCVCVFLCMCLVMFVCVCVHAIKETLQLTKNISIFITVVNFGLAHVQEALL